MRGQCEGRGAAGDGLSLPTTLDSKPRKVVVCSFSSFLASLSVFILSFITSSRNFVVSSVAVKVSQMWHSHFTVPFPFLLTSSSSWQQVNHLKQQFCWWRSPFPQWQWALPEAVLLPGTARALPEAILVLICYPSAPLNKPAGSIAHLRCRY